MVADRILQDALEEQRQLGGGARRVVFRELHHGILDDVEGGLFLVHGEDALLESAALDACEEIGQLLLCGQFSLRNRCGARACGEW